MSNSKVLMAIAITTSIFSILLLILLINTKSTQVAQTCPAPTPMTEKVIKQSELPLNVNVLQNQLIYEWKGSVQGTLVEKTTSNFTLEKNSNRITISIKEDYTKFYELPSSRPILIGSIPIGTYLWGTVLITTKGNPQVTYSGDILGELFYIPINK